MKKLLALALSAAMVLSLAACGNSGNSGTADPGSSGSSGGSSSSGAPNPSASGNPYETSSGWPTKENITLIVPVGAGGSMDLAARLAATELEKELGATVVVENVPGGGMWIGWKQLAAAKPDGYTFGAFTVPALVIGNYNPDNPQEEGPKDFIKICNQTVDYGALAIRLDDPRYDDLESLIAYAKENELICTAGARGVANGDASSAEWFNMNHGTKFTVMTVDSSSDGMARFYAGDSDCFFGSVGDLMNDQDAGIYKVVAVFSPERSELMPNVPTLVEQGYNYSNFSTRGFMFPAGVDQEIVDKMTQAMAKACEAASERVRELGMETYVVTGDDFEKLEQEQLVNRLAIYGLTTADKVAG